MQSLSKECLMVFRLKDSLSSQIPLEIQNKFSALARQKSYYASREALKMALKKMGISANTFTDLEIENHHHLVHYPDLLVSLSHTQHLGAAWVSKSDEQLSIGLDLELCQREVKKNTFKFFINSDDSSEDPLQLWVKKEAAFKAISSHLLIPDLTLKSIIIDKQNFHLNNNDKIKGIVTLKKMSDDDETFWLAQAFLPRLNEEL